MYAPRHLLPQLISVPVRQSRCAPALVLTLGKGLVLDHVCPALICESSIEHSQMLSIVHFGVLDVHEYFEQVFPPAFELINAGVTCTRGYCANPFVL
jgi:hypothetical protein